MSPVQHVSTRPPQRHGVSRPGIQGFGAQNDVALHDIEYEQDYYDPIPELTQRQASNSLLDEINALRVFNKAEWNQDGAHRYTVTENANFDTNADEYHAEFFVVLPGIATRLWSEHAPIVWELRDQHLRDAYLKAFFEPGFPGMKWDDMPEGEKNVNLLSVYYITELADWKDGEGNALKKVVGLKPVRVKFHTPPPMYGYAAARRFNAFLEIAAHKKNVEAKWLEGLYFKVGEGGILGLNDIDDPNYVAEMTDFDAQTDAIEMLLVPPEELERKLDTSKVKPDITESERRIEELEGIFESYIRAHPDAPRSYMTISIVMGLSNEYFALLKEFDML